MNFLRKCAATVFAAIFLIVLQSFALPAFALDEQVVDQYPSAAPPPQEELKEAAAERYAPGVKDLLKVRGFVDIQQGFDNNVELNSSRWKDGFIQATGNIDIGYDLTESFTVKAGSDIFDMTYYNRNSYNLLDVAPYAGLDIRVTPDIISRSRCIYDYFAYPNKESDTFSGITLSTYLRHYIMKGFYHEGGFEYLKRWYLSRKVTLATGAEGDENRADSRYRVQYNIGFRFDRFFVKAVNEFSRNYSNVRYQDYYDYWIYRLKPSVMFFFTDDLYVNTNFIYKYVNYRDRRSTENSNVTVRDNNYMMNSSLYYDLNENVTLEVTYSYSENTSNDPYWKYSGSVISAGFFYSF